MLKNKKAKFTHRRESFCLLERRVFGDTSVIDKQIGGSAFCLHGKAPRQGKPMIEEPHIGKLIKAELARQGRSITWLAAQLNYSRQYVYKMFRRKWIYSDLLLKICDILDYDFFKCFSDYRNSKKQA